MLILVYLSLLPVRIWWTSKRKKKKPHKHANLTKHMRTEIWSSHVIIQSVSTKNVPGSFIVEILSKEWKTKTKKPNNTATSFLYPTCFCVFTAWKRNSCFNLLLWQTKACQSSSVNAMKCSAIFKDISDAGHTATSGRAVPSKENIHDAQKSQWKSWFCSEIRSAPLHLPQSDRPWVMMVTL